ncbi:YveK family protein [Peribacillus sp. SCS-26]|uniref:YveK family protein n=1 Tax=Paraperibacillus marinus TaxID=3115295 RepID=UPI003906A3BA
MEETISIKELLGVIRKRMGLIMLITLAAVIVSAIISYFVLTPVYEASTQLLVNQKKTDQTNLQYNEVQTNLQLVNTYSEIIKSPVILEKVKDELDLSLTVPALIGKIAVSNQTQTQILKVSVQDEDPKEAIRIANKTAQVFERDIKGIMNMSVDNVKILFPADTGEKLSPVKPKPLLNIAIALVIGLMAGVGLAFLLDYMDNTIKTEQDIEKLLGLPVLGVIAKMDEKDVQQTRGKQRKAARGESVGA